MTWVADHRKHHAHTDKEGDPHSPHGHGGGIRGALAGLWYAHMGWLFDRAGQAAPERYAKDLYEDRGMQAIQRGFWLFVLAGFALPFGLGVALGGTLADGLTGALWGGAVRIFLLHHVTWSINSVCHFFGTRRFAVDDHSTNVFWLSLLSFGESWHHNHHAFPRSAVHGLRWWEIDPTRVDRAGDEEDPAGLERGRDHARAPAPEARIDGACPALGRAVTCTFVQERATASSARSAARRSSTSSRATAR